jgi:peptidyl-tRNA hydrolase
MVDEGFTEVEPGTATVFASYPFLHKDRPQVLDNKKVPLL